MHAGGLLSPQSACWGQTQPGSASYTPAGQSLTLSASTDIMMSERCWEMTSGQAASGPGLLMLTRSSLRMRHANEL
jgi:hypothetical protein